MNHQPYSTTHYAGSAIIGDVDLELGLTTKPAMKTEDETDSHRFALEAFPNSSPDRQNEIEHRALTLLKLQRRLGKATLILGCLMAAVALIFLIWNS